MQRLIDAGGLVAMAGLDWINVPNDSALIGIGFEYKNRNRSRVERELGFERLTTYVPTALDGSGDVSRKLIRLGADLLKGAGHDAMKQHRPYLLGYLINVARELENHPSRIDRYRQFRG